MSFKLLRRGWRNYPILVELRCSSWRLNSYGGLTIDESNDERNGALGVSCTSGSFQEGVIWFLKNLFFRVWYPSQETHFDFVLRCQLSLNQRFSPGQFFSRDIWRCLRHFHVSDGKVETMHAANHPTVHRTASCSKEFSGKNVSNAEVEELCLWQSSWLHVMKWMVAGVQPRLIQGLRRRDG